MIGLVIPSLMPTMMAKRTSTHNPNFVKAWMNRRVLSLKEGAVLW